MEDKNYINIFNDLLKEENSDNQDNQDNQDTLCLIDGLKLENNFIKLDCGHSFNYMALHNEIVYQKTKKILDNARLRLNEIKCPYCRKISNNLLPYFKYYNIEQIKGVNYPNNYSLKMNSCQYIDKKNNKCNDNACITCFGSFCNKHFKYTKVEEELLNNMDNDLYAIYKKKNLKQLKEELRELNLKLSGNKDELIKRIYIKKRELDNKEIQ